MKEYDLFVPLYYNDGRPIDEIVIYRVIAAAAETSRRFLQELKGRVKAAFEQEEILIVECDVETL